MRITLKVSLKVHFLKLFLRQETNNKSYYFSKYLLRFKYSRGWEGEVFGRFVVCWYSNKEYMGLALAAYG